MKTVCIYHSVDLDGWMSAAIVKYWFEKTSVKIQEIEAETNNGNFAAIEPISFMGYTYGDFIPDLSEYDKVIMCDISFPKDQMEELSMSTHLTWIDHHVSAINEINSLIEYNIRLDGLRDTKLAACELTWRFFFPSKPMPEIVRLLGLYDSFRHKGTDEEQKVLEFQYGARQCITNYEEAYEYLKECLKEKWIETNILVNIYSNGKAIYQYLCTEAKHVYKNGFEIELSEIKFNSILGLDGSTGKVLYRKFICINRERFNPINFGIDYHKDGYDGVACFWYKEGKWNFSLYNDNELVDCSVIAKQFIGGGHRGASGFVCDTDTMLKIINNE